MATYYPAKFGGHSHSANGVIMILVCHAISQEHLTKGSGDFMVGGPLMVSHHSAKFGIDIAVVEI